MFSNKTEQWDGCYGDWQIQTLHSQCPSSNPKTSTLLQNQGELMLQFESPQAGEFFRTQKKVSLLFFLSFFLKILFIFRERGREGERENNVRNIDQPPLTHTPTRDKPTTQVHALTWNRTTDPSFCGMMSNQRSHTGQGSQPFILFRPSMQWIKPTPLQGPPALLSLVMEILIR